MENLLTTTECEVNYQLLAVITEVAQCGTPSCSQPQQIRTMASEAVDPIDWSHPTLSWAVPPERLVHSINQINLSGNRMCNRRTRGNHLAYAVTRSENAPSDRTATEM